MEEITWEIVVAVFKKHNFPISKWGVLMGLDPTLKERARKVGELLVRRAQNGTLKTSKNYTASRYKL